MAIRNERLSVRYIEAELTLLLILFNSHIVKETVKLLKIAEKNFNLKRK